MVSSRTCSVSSSRWAVGSSRSTTGRSGEHDAGQRDAGPLAGGQAGTVLAERRARGRGAGRARRRRGRRCAGPPTPRRRRPRDGRAARWRATVPASSHGRCGAHADQAAPPARVEVGERGAADPDVAGARAPARRRGSASRVDLPQPDGPTIAIRPAVGQLEVERTGQGERRARSRSRGRRSTSPVAVGQRRAGLDRSGPRQEVVGRRRARPCPRRRRGTPRRRGAAASRPRGRAAGRSARPGSRRDPAPAGGPTRHRDQRDRQGGDQLQHRPRRRRRAAACRRWPGGSGR